MITLRSLIFVILFYIWSIFVAVCLSPVLIFPRRWTMYLIGVWGRGIVWLLKVCCNIKVEIRGREHMPTGQALVASKHQCMFDVFGQFAWLPDACFITKKELAWIPFFSWWAFRGKMIFVDRAGHATALRKLIRDAKERFVLPRQLLIFPEGTRTEPGAAPDYKPGIAALYRELDVPVHPVATNSGVHWPSHGFRRLPGTIVFEYLEPIQPGLKRAEFMRLLQDRIETASNKLLAL